MEAVSHNCRRGCRYDLDGASEEQTAKHQDTCYHKKEQYGYYDTYSHICDYGEEEFVLVGKITNGHTHIIGQST